MRRERGQARRVAMAPIVWTKPTTMNVPFIKPCSGEQTSAWLAADYGPQAVLPKSLMGLVAKLYGLADAACTIA